MSHDLKYITLNETVREAIMQALILLMKKKPFKDITILELTATAGVSRSSFYRNFESKEQLLIEYIQAKYLDFFREEAVPETVSSAHSMKQFLLPRFQFIKNNRDFFCILNQNQLLYFIFEQMETELLLHLGGAPKDSSKYFSAMLAGAYAGVIQKWIENDFRDSETDMVSFFSNLPFLLKFEEKECSSRDGGLFCVP